MSGKKSPPRQRALPFYPVLLTLEMVSEATVFCERCETQVMGSLAAHLMLHGTLSGSVHAHHAVEVPAEYYSPAAPSETEQVDPLRRYDDAVFDLN